jgi:adenylate cyclase
LVQRKLSAILAADIAGYTRLMETDEAGTLERLKANRAQIFDRRVAAQGGRIFKLLGDGALVEFTSAVAAVKCALEIQDATASAEMTVPGGHRLVYRIGINLGDVIIDGDDIYGEGVNVAARLQGIAPEGGIALSRNVFDQVTGKVAADFDDLGLHTVKNLERPVHVFTARPAAASQQKPQAERSHRVSICVLPFANMSGDQEQEYFSDGISEDIITDLSKVSALLVTARNTAFTFKGKNVDVPQVARQLKVSHVLDGSVRKAGGRVRINAQLIDCASGGHVWAERYDRDLSDIFALQDEISQSIVTALKLRLLPEEKKAIERRGTNDAEAYKLYLMARQYSMSGNYGSARRGETIIRLCNKAVEIDPNYARAWALIASAQDTLRFRQEGDGGLAAAERAITLDPDLAEAHAARARSLVNRGDQDEALREIELALKLDPESYEVHRHAGLCHYAARHFDRAVVHFEKAAALAEGDYQASGMLISSYQAIGDKNGARRAAQAYVERSEKNIAAEPDNGSAMSFLVGALALLGEVERARDWAERALLLDPDNHNMRYNISCAFVVELHERDAALDLLSPILEKCGIERINWMKKDPDLDAIRDHPRFQAMMAAAEARLQSND